MQRFPAPDLARTRGRTIDCDDQHPRRLVAAYVAGDLGDADRDAVDRHLDACGACQDRVADLLTDAAAVEGFDGGLPSPGLRDRVLARIESTPQEQDPPPGQSEAGDRDAPGSDGRR